MLHFDNLDSLRAGLGGVKGQRAAEAIQRADQALAEVTLSIGDSLTYRVTARPDCSELTGRHRYLDARAVLDGTATIEVAPAGQLQPTDAYSDLADRQHFAGAGVRHELGAGEIVVVEPGEAIRDVEVTGRVIVLRVTMEDGPS